MFFKRAFWPGLADGTITMTFRLWQRCQVVPDYYRTPAGIMQVDSMEVVTRPNVTDAEAVRSGFNSAAELPANLAGTLQSSGSRPVSDGV
jgi:hypothetical protein